MINFGTQEFQILQIMWFVIFANTFVALWMWMRMMSVGSSFAPKPKY